MKKTLFIATLSTLACPALWAAVSTSTTGSYTVGSTMITATDDASISIIKSDGQGEKNNLPTAPDTLSAATVLQNGRFDVTNTTNNNTDNFGTIVIATGTDEAGNRIEGGQLFADGWGTTTEIRNALVIGQSSFSESGYEGAIRINEGATISGNITLADDAKINSTGSSMNTISGNVSGNHTLTLERNGALTFSGTVSLGGLQSSANNVTFSNTVTVTGTITLTGGNVAFSDLVFDTSNPARYQFKETVSETTLPEESEDGFSTGEIAYYLLKKNSGVGLTTNGTIQTQDGTTLSANADGDYTFTANGRTDHYYANTENAESSDALGANIVTVKEGATFTLNSTAATAPTLGSIQGSGTVVVAVNTTLGDGTTTENLGANKSQATGKLVINEGVQLNLGSLATGGAHDQEIGDISSFSSVDLNGTLRINGLGSDIHNVTVGANGGTLYVWDTYNDFSTNEIALKGTTTLNGALNVTNRWKNNMRLESLTGSGNLNVGSGSSGNDSTVFTINSVAGYTGTMTFTKDQGALTAHVQIKAGETLNADQLAVANGATLNLKGAGTYTLNNGSSSLNGATLSTTEGAEWTGTVRVSGEQTSSVDLSELGTSHSVIALNGVSGSLADATVNSAVQLESTGNDALTITGEASNVTFNGDVTGGKNIVDYTSGSFTFNGQNNDFSFIGDEKPSSITFSGNATTIAASVKKHGNVTIRNTQDVVLSGSFTDAGWTGKERDVRLTIDNSGSTTFTGEVNVASVDVQNGSSVTFNGSTSMESLILSAGSTASIAAADSTDASAQAGSLALSDLTTGGSNATLNVGSLSLNDNATLTLESSLTLNGSLSTGKNLTLSGALYDILTSSETTVTLFSGVTSWTPTEAVVALNEGEVSYAASEVFNTQDWNNSYTYTLAYDGSQVTLTSQLVPEPTTATLSLLALAGLLARRRRK